jgi:predicted acyltransferase
MAKAIGALVRVQFAGVEVSLQEAIYRGLFAGWLEPRNASLAYALCFVLLWFGILALLHRRGLVLKV